MVEVLSKWTKTPEDTYLGELFNPKKLARTHDPSTSKAAAERAGELQSRHHKLIHETLSTMNDGTTYDVAEKSGIEVAAVFRRMNELEKLNKVMVVGERIGPTGRKCRVWKAI